MPDAATLLFPRPEGLYCPAGDFYVDPMRPVARALITHAHSDHARAGHEAVLASRETLAIMALRLGEGFTGSRQIAEPGRPVRIGAAEVTLFPAGHVLGSCQIRIDVGGFRMVVSGDYKREPDATAAPFEPIRCHLFVTEATFGLPVFRHPPVMGEVGRLIRSLNENKGRAHLVGAYSLGKAQRLIRHLREAGFDRPIYLHGALEKVTRFYQQEGIDLGLLAPAAGQPRGSLAGEIVLCPPSSLNDIWSRRFAEPLSIAASGWMRIRARARQKGVELPLVISDHADWDQLRATILETGADEIWVTHGQEDALVHWCSLNGMKARPLFMVGYGEEADEEAA
jgi:putative mRNA 3-end processing factor